MPTLSLSAPPFDVTALTDWRATLRGAEGARDAKVLVVFAHPGDESIGLGDALSRLRNVWFLCVTDGSPRDQGPALLGGGATRSAYAMRRRAELESALRVQGHRRERLSWLNVVDQEAVFRLRDIIAAVSELLVEVQPGLVVTHPYEGGHPDHDSTAFAVHMAIRSRRALGHGAPQLIEMTSYFNDGGAMRFGRFLPRMDDRAEEIGLDPVAQQRKRALLERYRSQADVLRAVPCDTEQFRAAPDYDFSEAPHAGELLYERFPCGMTGSAWRRHAIAALAGGLPARGAAQLHRAF